MEKEFNPFILSGYRGPEYFCDRAEETKQLAQYIRNGINVTLFALRRAGKTGLIHHVFEPYLNSRKIACIYVDILSTQNLTEFTNALATAVYNRFPSEKSMGKKIMEMFRLFRPVLSFDELNGTPSLSLTLETPAQKQNTIQQIFAFLDRQSIRTVFAIDEFQQILEYPEKNTEALLRTYIQQLKNTSFIFCGSNQKMMFEIFNSAKRPFFASCSNVHLGFIPENEYSAFIRQKFTENKREISDECIEFICDWTQLHTYYTQHFCHALFSMNKKKNKLEDAKSIALQILRINEPTFFQYRNLLTEAQWALLRGIAHEQKVYKPQSKDFIARHSLGTPSLVARSLDALLKKEMVFYNPSVKKPCYEVYDKFLMRWLQRM